MHISVISLDRKILPKTVELLSFTVRVTSIVKFHVVFSVLRKYVVGFLGNNGGIEDVEVPCNTTFSPGCISG